MPGVRRRAGEGVGRLPTAGPGSGRAARPMPAGQPTPPGPHEREPAWAGGTWAGDTWAGRGRRSYQAGDGTSRQAQKQIRRPFTVVHTHAQISVNRRVTDGRVSTVTSTFGVSVIVPSTPALTFAAASSSAASMNARPNPS